MAVIGAEISLPIDAVLPDLHAALGAGPNAVLQAPPGSGKTTRVPLALLNAAWRRDGVIVMLEPRRLAARAAARRMAQSLGEAVGETVGHRVRFDSRCGPKTRIEVVTEGVLIRRLQNDPELTGVAAVIFDEFHERSLEGDLGLALCLESQAALRPDLRVLVMSATLDGTAVAALMGGAPVLAGAGLSHEVTRRYLARDVSGRLEDAMAAAICTALSEETGSILAFLPGQAEIRRTAERLKGTLGPDVVLAPLYGALGAEAQDRALRPAPAGQRKVVLATDIAETSLTIEGIRVVIDGGLQRRPSFDPRSGMTRLVTGKVSRASATQRAGRAGRLEPGVCYRLWSAPAQRALPEFTPPEIATADLAPLVLDLAAWGVGEAGTLAWLDPPPQGALDQARELLERLEALDSQGRITDMGRRMAALPAHPRLAHMMVRARALGLAGLACDLAALLEERDPLRGVGSDLGARLAALHGGDARFAAHKRAAAQLRRRLGGGGAGDRAAAGLLLAFAYPDRIAQRRPGGAPRYVLANGRGAVLTEDDPLAGAPWLVVADLDGQGRDGRIYRAAPITLADLETHFAAALRDHEEVAWAARSDQVVARRQTRLGRLVLADAPLQDVAPEKLAAALCAGVRRKGLHCLPWDQDSRCLRERIAFLHRLDGPPWPDMSDAALSDRLEDWLGPYVGGKLRIDQITPDDLRTGLAAELDWSLRQHLDSLAPSHWQVPSGSRIALDYRAEVPVLAVRLQEMFGATETPRLAGGRVAVSLHLLSPAGRPVQVTQDLAGFWQGAYRQVKGELKGRYPRHAWPDDPLSAPATRRTKPRK